VVVELRHQGFKDTCDDFKLVFLVGCHLLPKAAIFLDEALVKGQTGLVEFWHQRLYEELELKFETLNLRKL